MSSIEFPTPRELKALFPLSSMDCSWIEETRHEVKAIIERRSSKKLLITGPCSIHHAEGALKCADYLKELQKLLPEWLVIMRAHLEKPRSSVGWKGYVYDPSCGLDPFVKPDLGDSRDLLIQLIRKRIPLSYELLDPFVYPFFEDCYTLGQIGARTIRSPIHRQLASMSSFAVGLKNPPDGQMSDVAQAFRAISSPQDFFGVNQEGKLSFLHTKGNPYSFVILRGTDHGINFSPYHIESHLKLFEEVGISPSFIVDCGHGNSQKSLLIQKNNTLEVLEMMKDPKWQIAGLMVESYLKEGSQSFGSRDPELSLTDPCLGIESLFSLFKPALARL